MGLPNQNTFSVLLNYWEKNKHRIKAKLNIKMWNARLDEAQAGIKIAGKNNDNLRHEDDTTLMAESEEELKSL